MSSLQFRKAADLPSLGMLGHKRRNFSLTHHHPSLVLGDLTWRSDKVSLISCGYTLYEGPRFVALKKYTITTILIPKHTVLPEKGLTWESQSNFSEETTYGLGFLN